MPILLVLALVAACLPVPWPEPPLGLGPADALALTAAVTAVPPLLSAALSAWVVVALTRRPDRRSDVLTAYGRLRRLVGWANLGLAALAVAGLGWGWTVWHAEALVADIGRPVVAPAAELLVPAPYFLALVLSWLAHYPAERTIHRTSPRRADDPTRFWSLPEYLLFHARQFALVVGLPVGLCVGQQSLGRVAPEVVASGWYHAASFVGVVCVFVLMPRLVKPVLGLRPLPPGPIRDRLEATARRLDVRYTDLLLWPTRGAVANAMVVGVVPWARYVVFTDRLLDGLTPAELDAVFGHEAGHIRHGHIPYYAGFLLLSAAVAGAVAVVATEYLAGIGWTVPDDPVGWQAASVVGMGVYLFVVFGLLSRRCERQADVFGCRAGSCGAANCLGHDDRTVLVPGGRGLCRTGVGALVRALDRVADLNGFDGPSAGGTLGVVRRAWAWLRAWQHGPVPARIEFLLRLSDAPHLGDRVDRRARWFRVGLAGLLLGAFMALGSLVGWAELWRQL